MLAAQPASSPVWSLLSHFETQRTQSFCSIATAAVLLNSLGVPRPVDSAFSPYPYFTQANVLGACALGKPSHQPGTPLSAGFIATHGATLQEWRSYLSCWANATARRAAASTVEDFRREAREALEPTQSSRIGLNFHRTELGEKGGGHMSPLAAYDAVSDRFLLLDVSRYKYPAAWVRAADLYAAMNTTDTTSGESRGWVVVRPPAPNATTVSVPQKPSWAAVRACIAALEPSDGHRVLACMAEPEALQAHSWRVDGGTAIALCVLFALCGAVLPRLSQRCRRGRETRTKLWEGSFTGSSREQTDRDREQDWEQQDRAGPTIGARAHARAEREPHAEAEGEGF